MPMMKCGHTSQATRGDGRPSCVICVGINPGAEVVDDAPAPLDGRNATCCYCKASKPSSPDLAFFESRPSRTTDDFYCGCRGWD